MATYRFEVGDITCIAIQEGAAEFDLSTIGKRYPNASEDEITQARDALGLTGEKSPHYFNVLYIKVGDTQILVDTGMGQNPERPQVGQTLTNLATEGISAEDIDIVYITHFHGDHYLGLLTDGQPTFPNARYVTQDSEWDFWHREETAEKMGERIQNLMTVLDPLRDQFSTLSAGEALAEGITVVDIAGHTMGQSGLLIKSGADSFLHLVDLLHHEAQFMFPEWQFVWDTDAELATQTRKAQLGNVSTRNMLVMFYHLPFPGIGHVVRDGAVFKWQAIEVS